MVSRPNINHVGLSRLVVVIIAIKFFRRKFLMLHRIEFLNLSLIVCLVFNYSFLAVVGLLLMRILNAGTEILRENAR